MSLLPLTNPTRLCLGVNAISLSVTDITYSAVNGVDKATITGTRIIQAAVDSSSGRQIEQIFGGPVADGDLAIWPLSEELYYTDAFSSGDVRKQSFISYDGITYRVTKGQNFRQMAGIMVYRAERHINQDVI